MYRKHFPVIIEQDEDGVYIVSCPTLRGCHSYGHTVEEAVDNIIEAIEVCLEEKNQPPEMAMQFIGSHIRFVHPDGRKTTIPDHGGQDVPNGLLNKIVRNDLEMTLDDFFMR